MSLIYARFIALCAAVFLAAGCNPSGGTAKNGEPSSAGPAETGSPAQNRLAALQAEKDPQAKATGFLELARTQHEAGDPANAEQSLAAAEAAAIKIIKASDRLAMLTSIADAAEAQEHPVLGRQAIQDAVSAAARLFGGPAQVAALTKLAVHEAKNGQKRFAEEILATAEKSIDNSTKLGEKSLMLIDISVAYRAIGNPEHADRFLNGGLNIAEVIGSINDRSIAYARAGLRLHELGEQELSEKVFTHAITLCDKIPEPVAELRAMAEIADILAQAGEASLARTTLDRAAQSLSQIKDEGLQSEVQQKLEVARSKVSAATR